MWCRPESFYTGNGALTVKACVLATTLDAETGPCGSRQAKRLAYDRLLAATGSRPVRCRPFPGWKRWKRTFCFQTLSDAGSGCRRCGRMSRRAHSGRGLHRASNAPRASVRPCAQIAIADLAPRVLPAVLDDTAAAPWCKPVWRRRASVFTCNRQRGRIPGQHGPAPKRQHELEFDVLVTAGGCAAKHAAGGGCRRRGGPRHPVDGRCATSASRRICCGRLRRGIRCGERRTADAAAVPNAMLQGEYGGHQHGGRPRRLHAGHCPQRFARVRPAHDYGGSDEGESFTVQRDGSYKRLVTADGVLKGVIMVGDVSRAGHLHRPHPQGKAAVGDRL